MLKGNGTIRTYISGRRHEVVFTLEGTHITQRSLGKFNFVYHELISFETTFVFLFSRLHLSTSWDLEL